MEILSFLILPILIVLFLIHISMQPQANSKRVNVDEFQEHIEEVVNLPPPYQEPLQNKPASEQLMRELEDRGIYLQRSLTKGQAMNILGLFSPPDSRQVDILKYFNIPYSEIMNQTMARHLILGLFSDPNNVDKWHNRPPTSTERLGLLFMEGKLVSGLTHIQAHAKLYQLSKEQPERYQEWKQIERLFPKTNKHEIRTDTRSAKSPLSASKKATTPSRRPSHPGPCVTRTSSNTPKDRNVSIIAHAEICDLMESATTS